MEDFYPSPATISPPKEEKNIYPSPVVPQDTYPSPAFLPVSSRVTETSTLSNMAAGFLSGTQKTMEADLGNVLTSYIDLGRFMSADPEGEKHLWQSTPDWMGIEQSEWDSMDYVDRRLAVTREVNRRVKEEFSPDEASAAYNLAKFVGLVATPSSAIPLASKTYKGAAASGAALGAVSGGLYSASEKGQVEGEDVLLGAGLGAALPVGLKAVGRGINNVASRRYANKQLDEINLRLNRARKYSGDINEAFNKVKESMGLNDAQIDEIIKTSKSPVGLVMSKTKQKASKYLHQRELEKLQKENKLGYKAVQTVKRPFKKIIEPIGSRINAISPTVRQQLVIKHLNEMDQIYHYTERVHPFLKKLQNLEYTHPKIAKEFKKHALDADGKNIKDYLNKYLGGEGDYLEYRKVMDELYDMYIKSGRKIKKFDFYFPRYIKDIKGLRATLNMEEVSQIDKHIAALRKKKGRTLTEDDINDVYNKYLRGLLKAKGTTATPSTTKARRIQKLQDRQLSYYEDLPYAIHRYIDNAVKDVQSRNFFKTHLGTTAPIEDAYIEKNVGDVVRKLVESGKIAEEQATELQHLLEIEFVKSKRVPNFLVKKFKDYSYASFLGNPFSAATQLGDIPLGGFVNGLRNTLGGLKLAMTGKGLSPKEMGLMENMLQEFSGGGGFSEKFLKKSLKWGGFSNIDMTAKGINLNGSVMKYKNALKNDKELAKVLKDWRPIYSEKHLAKIMKEFDSLDFSKDIAKQLGPDARAMVLSDLMKTQPLTTLDMPEMYHAMPNGRVMYMFRTFTLKYVNLLYRSLVDDWRQGNFLSGAQKAVVLMSIFSATGTATDWMKQTAKGKEPDVGQLVWDNVLKNTGYLDRYTVNQLGKSATPAEDLTAKLVPPVGIFDPLILTARSIATGDWENFDAKKAWERVPVFGQVATLAMGGYHENQVKALDDRMKLEEE